MLPQKFCVTTLLFVLVLLPGSLVARDTLALLFEFDGNSPGGTTSFGTVDLSQNGLSVDVQIVADTITLGGGDIHELYFNLPDAINIGGLTLTNSGGISNHPVSPFALLGANPSVVGGAGAAFDTGVNFGNGGGPPGNGVLTTATFSLSAPGGLTVSDLLTQASTPNNTPPVFVAVHFQGTSVFGSTSETVGGTNAVPEPTSGLIAMLGIGCTVFRRRR